MKIKFHFNCCGINSNWNLPYYSEVQCFIAPIECIEIIDFSRFRSLL